MSQQPQKPNRFQAPETQDPEAKERGQKLSSQFQQLEKEISTHIREQRVKQAVDTKLDHLWESVKESLTAAGEDEEEEDEEAQKKQEQEKASGR